MFYNFFPPYIKRNCFSALICGWGVMFITVTTLIAIFKKEKDCTLEDNHVKFNVLQSYSLLWYILKLPSVQLLAIIMLTVKVSTNLYFYLFIYLFEFHFFYCSYKKIRDAQNTKHAIAPAVTSRRRLTTGRPGKSE